MKSDARNELEANFYRIKDHLEKKSFLDACRDDEIEQFSAQFKVVSQLLELDAEAQTRDIYVKALGEIVDAENKIKSRIQEHLDRPIALSKLKKQISVVDEYVQRIRTENPTPEFRAQTEADLLLLENLVQESKGWAKDVEEKNGNLELKEEPVHLSASIDKKSNELSRHLSSIMLKKIPVSIVAEPSSPIQKPSETIDHVSSTETASATEPLRDHGEL